MPLSLDEQYDKIYTYCYHKVKHTQLAEDVTQETFLRFFSQNSYISRGKALAYLYTIARNLCTDAFRKIDALPLPDEAVDATAEIDTLDTAIAVREAVRALPQDVQEILLLRYSNDLSMAEISRITGLSRFALRRRINEALAQLKQVLSEEDFS